MQQSGAKYEMGAHILNGGPVVLAPRWRISAAVATVRASLAFTPYLTHKKQQEIDQAEQKYLTGLV